MQLKARTEAWAPLCERASGPRGRCHRGSPGRTRRLERLVVHKGRAGPLRLRGGGVMETAMDLDLDLGSTRGRLNWWVGVMCGRDVVTDVRE